MLHIFFFIITFRDFHTNVNLLLQIFSIIDIFLPDAFDGNLYLYTDLTILQ